MREGKNSQNILGNFCILTLKFCSYLFHSVQKGAEQHKTCFGFTALSHIRVISSMVRKFPYISSVTKAKTHHRPTKSQNQHQDFRP